MENKIFLCSTCNNGNISNVCQVLAHYRGSGAPKGTGIIQNLICLVIEWFWEFLILIKFFRTSSICVLSLQAAWFSRLRWTANLAKVVKKLLDLFICRIHLIYWHLSFVFSSREGRINFSIRKFAAKYNLGQPVAGNFFQAQYDDYVRMLHEQLSAKWFYWILVIRNIKIKKWKKAIFRT